MVKFDHGIYWTGISLNGVSGGYHARGVQESGTIKTKEPWLLGKDLGWQNYLASIFALYTDEERIGNFHSAFDIDLNVVPSLRCFSVSLKFFLPRQLFILLLEVRKIAIHSREGLSW